MMIVMEIPWHRRHSFLPCVHSCGHVRLNTAVVKLDTSGRLWLAGLCPSLYFFIRQASFEITSLTSALKNGQVCSSEMVTTYQTVWSQDPEDHSLKGGSTICIYSKLQNMDVKKKRNCASQITALIAHLIKEIPTFYRTQRYVTVFARGCMQAVFLENVAF